MPLEKILQSIRHQIGELTSSLEVFLDPSVQPTTDDCEKLKQHLCATLDQLAVYKYHKTEKELSPSFKLHAKVSEVQSPVPVSETIKETRQSEPAPVISPVQETVTEKPSARKGPEPLTIAINDKFRFINELFSQNSSEYHIALEQINNLHTWPETELYLASLKSVYGWKDNNEGVKHFVSLVKRRFS